MTNEYTGSIYWKNIDPTTMKVIDTGKSFKVAMRDGTYRIADWQSIDQPYAQQWLQRQANKNR